MYSWRPVLAAALCVAALSATAQPPALELSRGDRVCIVGNTFAERLYHFGHLEYLIRARFPDLNLTFRNLAWSADEVALRPRPLDFGSIHEHLQIQEADVILACYGFNEAFGGTAKLDQFVAEYGELLTEMEARLYNGKSAPRIALVSPIPMEPKPQIIGGVVQRNAQIAEYAQAIEALAAERGLPYIDIHDMVRAWHQEHPDQPLSINGVHLSEYGDWVVSQMMYQAMGYTWPDQVLQQAVLEPLPQEGPDSLSLKQIEGGLELSFTLAHWPAPSAPDDSAEGQLLPLPMLRIEGLTPGTYELQWPDGAVSRASAEEWAAGVPLQAGPSVAGTQELRDTINYKNRLFFDKYRAVNGYYIYGGRKEPFGVISFPPEMERFEVRVGEFETTIGGRLQQPVKVQGTLRRIEE
jgi:hypothetical protein